MQDISNFKNIENIKIVVSGNKKRERIDKFIFTSLKQISRNKIQKLIEAGFVLVNGKEVKTNHKVNPDEIINIKIPRSEPISIEAENIDIDFTYQDEYLAIINKQAGLVVHPTYSTKSGTLVNALMYHFKNQLSSVNGSERPGIVHRLDKDTTGLMVVAKNDLVHKPLADQFADKSARRVYYGICMGKLKEEKGRVETLLTRSPRDRRIIINSKYEGKRAVTNYELVEEFNNFSLVKFILETGRTHQIRVHMKYLGKPLFGDKTYGGTQLELLNLPKNQTRRLNNMLEVLPRQALHAKFLEIYHPVQKKRINFEIELPEDMKKILELIREYEY